MNILLSILLILVLLFMVANYRARQRKKRRPALLLEQWGQPKGGYFDFAAIASYHAQGPKGVAYHSLAAHSVDDLDVHALFKYIDRTQSKLGQQYLYHKLMTVPAGPHSLEAQDSLSQLMLHDADLRVACQEHLLPLGSNEAYHFAALINDMSVEKPSYMPYIYASSVAALLCVLLSWLQPALLLCLIPLFAVNVFFHYSNKANIERYIRAVKQFAIALPAAKKLYAYPAIQQHFPKLSFWRPLEAISSRARFIGWESALSNEFAVLYWLLAELFKIQFLLEYIVFFSFVDKIKAGHESMQQLFSFIGDIDTAISIASLKADAKTTCTPTFVANKQMQIEGLIHPLVDKCVPNSMSLMQESMLLTGSNMSGKTTFVRAVALNVIMAQSLNLCFATRFSSPWLRVHTSIRIADDLLKGTSYYLQEVLRVKQLLEAAKDSAPCLFVLYEIFKGTNTVERIAAGQAILSYLGQGPHIVLASTHDIELTHYLQSHAFALRHFCEHIEEGQLLFDYKLKEGRLRTRNAIKILELYDYPTAIVQSAHRAVSEAKEE